MATNIPDIAMDDESVPFIIDNQIFNWIMRCYCEYDGVDIYIDISG